MGLNEKKYYVWRITTDWNEFALIHKELMKNHILRQGWGLDGMRIDKTFADFHAAWPENWGDEPACKKRFNILYPMMEIQEGDIIIVPRVDMECDHPRNAFIVSRCIGTYNFEPLQLKNGWADFGHYISVEVLFSCDNEFNNDSLVIRSKFHGYQSAINRVKDADFMHAVEHLIQLRENGELANCNQRNIMDILSEACGVEKKAYLDEILKKIRGWSGDSLEKIIKALFEKNGYALVKANHYDKQGGDVDLVFDCFPENSLMSSVYSASANCVMPSICIQAKNKKGQDYNDLKGIEQLVKMRENYERPILILINTEDEFTIDAKNRAISENVVLLNGVAFADLLVRYGLA